MTVLDNLLLVPEQQRGENFFNAWLHPRLVDAQEQAWRERAEEILQRVKLHYLRHEYAAISLEVRKSCWSWRVR